MRKTRILLGIIFIIGCNTSVKNFDNLSLTDKDTIYILFENDFNRMNKQTLLQYKDKDPKYYFIPYNLSVYWEEKRDTLEDGSLNDGYRFIGDFNHSFWYGTYKVFPEYPEFDDSQIYGSSVILKKHKSFLKKNKNKILDYSWFKNRTPPNVWKIFKPFKLNKDKPTLFLLDKDEFSKDSIVLRNVVYHQEVIE